MAELTDEDKSGFVYKWRGFWARPKQLPPEGDWSVWFILAGRAFGKTRSGAEFVRAEVEAERAGRIALVAPTAADTRDVIAEGDAGILAVCPPWNRPKYEPSKRRITWPNGAQATLFSADEPERLRGPQHDCFWADELAAWNYPEAAWDNLMLGLRIGERPRGVVTTTPKPIDIVKDLLQRSDVAVTRGSTYENRANLAPAFFDQIIRKYEGTRVGLQELHAEILADVEGALWTRAMIGYGEPPLVLDRVVVAIDPAVTAGEHADWTGIVVAGVDYRGVGYVLDDLSCKMSPDAWATRAVRAYHDYRADRIIAEVNNGGDLVRTVLHTVDPRVSYGAVHASRGKRTRAEPVAALYEQGKVIHARAFPELEAEMCTYVPGETEKSPDRMDALVWALTSLILNRPTTRVVSRSYVTP
jgi:predicted phage terminase large subunit-like protein